MPSIFLIVQSEVFVFLVQWMNHVRIKILWKYRIIQNRDNLQHCIPFIYIGNSQDEEVTTNIYIVHMYIKRSDIYNFMSKSFRTEYCLSMVVKAKK